MGSWCAHCEGHLDVKELQVLDDIFGWLVGLGWLVAAFKPRFVVGTSFDLKGDEFYACQKSQLHNYFFYLAFSRILMSSASLSEESLARVCGELWKS